jgi:hypothetical protein
MCDVYTVLQRVKLLQLDAGHPPFSSAGVRMGRSNTSVPVWTCVTAKLTWVYIYIYIFVYIIGV